MSTVLLECGLVEFPKTDKELRNFNKEFAANLAQAIKAEGMYNAIVVRPNPEKPGHYVGVQGKHRHYAKHKILKEQFIECNVFPDMTAEEHEMAMIAENLWRNPLTKGQQTLSVKRWYEYYQKMHPETGKTGAAGQKARKEKSEAAKKAEGAEESGEDAKDSTASLADGKAETATESEGSNEGGFTDRLAAATGQSKRSAERELRVAKAFTEEQLEALDQMKVSKGHREQIAKVKDEANRGAIVNLIASGMEADDAIKEVMKDAAPVRADQSKAKAEATAAAKEEKATVLTDDEWFETFCGDKAKLLANPEKYRKDALLYRKVVDARAEFRAKVKSAVKAVKESKLLGPFYNNLNRLIAISHPKDWPLCSSCSAKGVDDKGVKCKTCYGCCFQLKVEEYQ